MYIILFTGLLAGAALKAQILTKSMNEPVAGDIHATTDYDSISVIPRNTGINQSWNFSTFTEVTGSAMSTFVTASSVPFSSNFPGATLVENQGAGDYLFYKSATTPTTQFESLGFGSSASPTTAINFTNSAIQYIWPIAYGNSFSDAFSGKLTGSGNGTYAGTTTMTASGSGTIVMPGGKSYTNMLQVKSVRNVVTNLTSPFPFSYTTAETQYDYFEPSQKFSLLTVLVSLDNDGTSLDTPITVTVNKIITVGITDRNFDADYAVYPNPAKDHFSIKLSNNSNETCVVEIFNTSGQLVKKLNSAIAILLKTPCLLLS